MTTTKAPREIVPVAVADSKVRRAAEVADSIIEDVMAMGWPVGDLIGAEPELLERYQVSRAVFREAVRILEHQQVAHTRRGLGGGLIITEPTVGAVINAVVLYLHRVDARLDEVFEARIVLEEIASQLAPARLHEGDLVRLRAFVDADRFSMDEDPRALHTLVASISGNSALELFVDVLNRVAHLYSADWRRLSSSVADETVHAHARIAEAVIAGEAGMAKARMRKHLEAEAEFLRRRRSTRQLLPNQIVFNESDNVKGAELVARNLAQTIVGNGMQPGQLVGTESELIAREGVSRALLREAVRLLEHHKIARMRRGPGGGLFVMAPSASAVTDIAAIYLARRGMKLAELSELRTGVEVAIVDLAATRIGEDGVMLLHEALSREETASEAERVEAVHDLHAAIAGASQNRVLELVALVLIRLSRINQIERLAPRTRSLIRAEVYRSHDGIVLAVESGDRELARHRMRRHLEALATFVR